MSEMNQSGTNIVIGEDLYGISVTELENRIVLLKTEITRVEAELSKKQKDLLDAEQLFGKNP
jgi:uncharacterized small protein (DUF1192 family)